MADAFVPIGTLLKFLGTGLKYLVDPFKKFLFLDAYIVSHKEYLELNDPRKHIYALGRFLKYNIYLESDHVSDATVPMSFLILRNVSDRTFHRVELLVEADAGSLKYQDFTTLIDVGSTPLKVYLPRIPLKDLYVQNHKIIITYTKVRVKATIFDNSLSEYEAKAEALVFHPTYSEFLNSCWDRKWDKLWNLDHIEYCKTDLKITFKYYLVTRNEKPFRGEPQLEFPRKHRPLLLLIGRPLFKILSYEWVISTLFWLPICTRIRKLRSRKEQEDED